MSLGYGVYINSSTGSVLVDTNTRVSDNRGDGIKYNFHRREPDRSASDTFQDFCSGASNPNQAYPIVTVYNQDRFSVNDLTCSRVSAASVLGAGQAAEGGSSHLGFGKGWASFGCQIGHIVGTAFFACVFCFGG